MGKPESINDDRNAPGWQIASASVVGTGHVSTGQPCQDATQYRYLRIPGTPRDTLVAAVADGAGSAPYSDQGSRLAASASINTVADALAQRWADIGPDQLRELLTAAMAAARQAVDKVARKNGHRIREYATTLLIAVHVNGLLGAAQIGDGAVVAAGENGEYELITKPDRGGEYANETSFVTQSRAVDATQISIMPDYGANRIAMFSDGIQNLVLDYRERTEPIPHAPFFSAVFSWLEGQPDELTAYVGLRQFLKSPRVNARTNDDVSLLLARRLVD